MPSFAGQIDLVFYAILAFAVLFGFLRGMKKTIFNLIVMAIFYIVFFITLDTVVNTLWTMNLGFLGNALSGWDASLAGFQSFESDYQSIIQVAFGDSFDFTQPEMAALAVGLIQFALKIVWFIVYFTVILVIYKIITGIIRLIFVKKGENKHRLGGALFGLANGVMAVFVTMIVLGGSVSFIESASLFINTSDPTPAQTVSFEPNRDNILELNHSIIAQDQIIELAEGDPLVPDDMIEMMNDLVDNYNGNILVQTANTIQVASTFDETEKVPLHINLFDSVLSFTYQEQPIALRHEVAVFANAYYELQDSDFGTTGDVMDLTGGDIRAAFVHLKQSTLIPTVIPIAINYLAESNGLDITYDGGAVTQAEVQALGNIAAGVFDILNEETVSIDENGDEVAIDGLWVQDLFSNISSSELVLFATEAMLQPMIVDGDGTLSQVLDFGDTYDWSAFDWASEYTALGDILAEMVDQGVSISSIQGGEAADLLTVFAGVQPDTLLSSTLLEQGLINILSGSTDIEGLDVLTVPSGIVWKSTNTVTGELEYILTAIQAIINDQDSLDLENFDIDLINALSDTTINAILDSYIIRATITEQVATLSLGDYNLVIPDQVLDAQDYYTKDELVALIGSVKLVYDQIDTFDLDTLFSMDQADYADLFESKIVRATITDQLSTFDLNGSALIIPNELYETVDYLTIDALTNVMMSIKVISDDLDTFTLDTIFALDSAEYTQFFGSKIIRATITNELSTYDLGDNTLVIPAELYETADYLTTDALTKVMMSIKVISDDLDTFTLDVIYGLTQAEYTQLFTSKIIRATITTQLETFDLGTDTLVIPDSLYESADYLTTASLTNLMLSLDVISDDIDTFTVDALYAAGTDYDTLFNSIIIRATITDMLTTYNLGTFSLVIPDDVYETPEYMTKAELVNLMTAIQMFSGDVSTFTLDSLYAFDSVELNTIYNSEIMQATMSDIILDNAINYQDTNQLVFIVPDAFRENIDVNSVQVEQIEKAELIKIILAFNVLGLSDFDGGVSPALMTSAVDYNVVLDSASMHITFDNIIDSNASLDVPSLALEATLYGFNNVTTDTEIIALINAVNALGSGDDVTNVSFSFATIAGLNETDRNTMITSMIVRNMITPEIETAAANPLDPYTLEASDYENNDTNLFLTILGVQDFIAFFNS